MILKVRRGHITSMGPEAGSEAFLCFLPPSHGSQIAFLPPRLCYSIFPYKLPFAPVTSSQKPRLIPFLIFPLPPPHLVFIPCISSLCSLGFSGLELTSSTSSLFFSFPLLSFCTTVSMITTAIFTPIHHPTLVHLPLISTQLS